MQLIHLTTYIAAPVERVFDLSRNLSVHKFSMNNYDEQIISGKPSGLMEAGDEVEWQAKHIFKKRTMKVRMAILKSPEYFKDEQVSGPFKMMKHEHYFKPVENGTLMIDQFYFETPYGIAGNFLNRFYLKKYMTKLLNQRNQSIKQIAESNQWKQYLEQ